MPARDKEAAARLTARMFGLSCDSADDQVAPVRVNDDLTFLFANQAALESHHYAFHMSDIEFDNIIQRVQAAGLSYGSAPWSLDDRMLNDWNWGRGVYFEDLDDLLLELMAVPQQQQLPSW